MAKRPLVMHEGRLHELFGDLSIPDEDFIYFRGDADTDGSVRVSSPDPGVFRVEHRVDGTWAPTSAGGGGLTWVSQGEATTIVSGFGYGCTEGLTLTLPENPEVGDTFGVKDVAYNAEADPIVIDPNGRMIENSSDNMEIDIDGAGVVFVFFGNDVGWLQVSEAGYATSGGGGGGFEGDHNDLDGREDAEAHPATAISYDSTENSLTATDVQSAIDELEALVGPIEIVTVTEAATAEFDKMYSLQGTGSYTVSLPAATAGNEGRIIALYKEGNSALNSFVTVNTDGGQEVRANSTALTSLQFRFQGELIILISHGDHWDVRGSSSLFTNAESATDEASLLNAVAKMNWLGGGVITLSQPITLGASRTVDLTGIRVFGDAGEGTRIDFPDGHVLSVTGAGFYFDSVRFKGVRTARNTGTSQHILTLVSDEVNAGKFENCVFRNVVTTNINNTNGNISISRDGGSGWNISFTDCDVFTAGSGAGDGLHFVNIAANNSLSFINLYGIAHRRVDSGWNRLRLTGNTFSGGNANVYTDGSVLIDEDAAGSVIGNAYITTGAQLITLQAEKATPASTDQLLLSSTDDAGSLRRTTVGNLLGGLAIDHNTLVGRDAPNAHPVAAIDASGIDETSNPGGVVLAEGGLLKTIATPIVPGSLLSGTHIVTVFGEVTSSLSLFNSTFIRTGGAVPGPEGQPSYKLGFIGRWVDDVEDNVNYAARIFHDPVSLTEALLRFEFDDVVRLSVSNLGDIFMTSGRFQYFWGDATTDGSVRISSPSAGTIAIQHRVEGDWVTLDVTGGAFVLKAGDTMTGNLVMGANQIEFDDETNQSYIQAGTIELYGDNENSMLNLYYDAVNNRWVFDNYNGMALGIRNDRIVMTPSGIMSNGAIWMTANSPVYYRGDATTDGSVRISSPSASTILIEQRTGGVWAEIELGGGSEGGGLAWQTQATSTTVVPGVGYGCESGITLTLPASPTVGDPFGVKDVAYNAATDPIIIDPNGGKIENSTSNLEIDIDGAGVIFVYFGEPLGWLQVSEAGYSAAAGGGGSVPPDSKYTPYVVEDTTTGLVDETTHYSLDVTAAMGSLVALDADVSPYDDIVIGVSAAGWTTTDVGTFRLDIVVKAGQTISFDNIDGSGTLTLTEGITVALVFDKPYGTSQWYVRQHI